MYPHRYIEFLYLFQCRRDYFECHEVLETEWKQKPKGYRDIHWVGLIQVAVTLYHYRQGNLIGAQKMIRKAINNLSPNRQALRRLGLEDDQVIHLLYQLKERIDKGDPYQDITLPVADLALIRLYYQQATKNRQ
ncbi:DUF309 domain-containing protein [Tuberibacillus sp. Marseille-P3662]|uniref:DUF309 domain-containing protein n=1 Tax=Tuberibacillus sp. Marseille-P3662 TaxID=1965358 RepID=UPI000A1CEE59|nr:DUF309 domain-containing protein [Tuberibacillus sp. Marseille-P3662]